MWSCRRLVAFDDRDNALDRHVVVSKTEAFERCQLWCYREVSGATKYVAMTVQVVAR
jgi:hypothetical protein